MGPGVVATNRPSAGWSRPTAWLFGAVAAVAYLAVTSTAAILVSDEAFYVGLARSIATGEGYLFNGAPHAEYPPGYPLVLAPLVAALGVDVRALALYTTGWGLLALTAVWVWVRARRASPWFAALFVLSTGALAHLTWIGSEALFVLALFGLLALTERARTHGVAWVTLIGTCALGAALPAARSVGVALLLAAPVTLWVMWRRGALASAGARVVGAALVGAATYQGAWQWWIGRHGSSDSYYDLLILRDPHEPDLGTVGLLELPVRLVQNLGAQLTRSVELVINVVRLDPFLLGPLQIGLLVLVAWGVRRELARENPLAGWLFAAYVLVQLSWPFDEGTRFMMPVLPLILLFAWRGVESLDRGTLERHAWAVAGGGLVLAFAAGGEVWLRGPSKQGLVWAFGWVALAASAMLLPKAPPLRRARQAVVAAYVLGFSAVGVVGWLELRESRADGISIAAMQLIVEVLPWIEANTDADEPLLATRGAAGIHLQTGRVTRELPPTRDGSRLWEVAITSGARLLVVPDAEASPYYRPTGPEMLDAMSAARPGVIALEHEYDGGRVFRLGEGSR